MQNLLNRPKRFGEILDLTFQLSKQYFKSFMKIFLIVMTPLILIEALIHLSLGVSFFREVSEGASFIDQILNSLEYPEGMAMTAEGEGTLAFIGLITLIFYPITVAAVFYAIDHIRKGETFTVRSVLKQAFSRFWAMLGSNLILFFILLGVIIVSALVITATIIGGNPMDFTSAILWTFVVMVGSFLGISLLLTRISFYLGIVVIEESTPGFIRSWQLSKGRTWALFGLYFVLFLILGAITFAVEMSLLPLLGYSVLYSLIYNLVVLFTSMVTTVCYAVMFFDLKARNDATDLIEMIDDYNRKDE